MEKLLSRDVELIKHIIIGVETSVETGTYGTLEHQLNKLSELGFSIKPLNILNMKIESRENYLRIASMYNMEMPNNGLDMELKELRQQKNKLIRKTTNPKNTS